MVTEGYYPIVIYLQVLGFPSYSCHRPLERANRASPFLGQHSGSGYFIGPVSPLWPSGWAPIFEPHQKIYKILIMFYFFYIFLTETKHTKINSLVFFFLSLELSQFQRKPYCAIYACSLSKRGGILHQALNVT